MTPQADRRMPASTRDQWRNAVRHTDVSTGAILLPFYWGIQNILGDHRMVFEVADQGDLVKMGEMECV
jgi:hypothetical protein